VKLALADESRHDSPAAKSALFALGFRPFFLLAALLATLYVPLWLLVYFGKAVLPSRLYGPHWHGHEMVFGFAVAVIAGFLLTAARNWTSRPTLSGAPLGGLVGIWALGRVAILFSARLPHTLVALVDVAFLPALAIAIAAPVVRARNWRNLGFVPLLLLLAGANAVFHTAPLWSSRVLRFAIDVVLVIIVVLGGRVIPSFTANALRVDVRKRRVLDWASLASMFAVTVLDPIPPLRGAFGVAAIIAGVIHLVRLAGWHPLATRKQPILWVLHLGYAWLALGLVLVGVGAFVPRWNPTAPLHALAVGCIAMLILGMTSRVSLGHTGRRLIVNAPMIAAYALLATAAVLRSVGPIVAPAAYAWLLVASGAAWALAFALFAVVYAPILTAPRVDGKSG
jgi:uncharacterized protein involved in response to NO